MELCGGLAQPISCPPTLTFLTPTPFLLPHLRPLPLSRSSPCGLRSRVLYINSPLPKATTSEESSSNGSDRYFGEESDSVATLEEAPAVDKTVYNENLPPEEPKEESSADEGSLSFDFLEQFNIKLDSEDAFPVLLYGSGALLALWLSSAVVGAIDSIPLFPKLMEIVGLGYTVWFSSRYLLFKKNREDFLAKIEELKQQVLGLDSD